MAESKVKDGGPAFPVTASREGIHEGMTLRQYYAGQALAGITAMNGHEGPPWKRIAKECFDAADAMIAEEEKVGK